MLNFFYIRVAGWNFQYDRRALAHLLPTHEQGARRAHIDDGCELQEIASTVVHSPNEYRDSKRETFPSTALRGGFAGHGR
jgi:hypothetical protein